MRFPTIDTKTDDSKRISSKIMIANMHSVKIMMIEIFK
jgi:hypothetical protein